MNMNTTTTTTPEYNTTNTTNTTTTTTMSPNSNVRNGSIKKCRINASKTPYKATPTKLAKTEGGIEYDPIIYFVHNETVYQKATDQYRADDGTGWCQVCVRGYKNYKKKHHHTCTKAKNYCDVKQQLMVEIKKRLRYEGATGLCDPKTGAVLNLTELPNGELKQTPGLYPNAMSDLSL